MSCEDVHICEENGVVTITLNRPERLNALTTPMYRSLLQAIRVADEEARVRALLLQGSNDYFTSGTDVTELIGFRKEREFLLPAFHQCMHACTKPIVAAVEGAAIGVGATLLQYCDFVYAGESTRFQLPFVDDGLCMVGGISAQLATGPMARQARRWLMLGESFSSYEALDAGLVTQVTRDGEAGLKAQSTARHLAKKSLPALRATKQLLNRAHFNITETMAAETERFTALVISDDAQSLLKRVAAEQLRGRLQG